METVKPRIRKGESSRASPKVFMRGAAKYKVLANYVVSGKVEGGTKKDRFISRMHAT